MFLHFFFRIFSQLITIKIPNTSDYFLVKFELILSIEDKYAFKKIGGKFWEISRKLRNSEKKLEKNWENFYKILHLIGLKSLENLWNLKINFESV